jgi:hypothetical protein
MLSTIFGETKMALTMPRKKHVRGTMVYGLLELELVEKGLERGTPHPPPESLGE